MDQEQYHVLESSETGYALAAQTNGRHKRLMRLYLRCAAVDRATKEGICSRFRWDPEDEISEETSEDAFYAEAAEIVLIGCTAEDPDEVVRPEVDRAIDAFTAAGSESGGALSSESSEGLGAFLKLLTQAAPQAGEGQTANGSATAAT